MTTRLFRASLLITGSGFCALIYQIVWMRELRLVFGASTAATAAVTAVFMGGLGAGSAILGKRADHSRHPMRLYARLEFLIAGLALVSPFLINAARHLYAAAGGTMAMGMVGGTLARLLLSTIILGGATFAMGGTLPAVVRSLETAADADRKRTALLYGMNTAGAVMGVMITTFWMIEIFGLQNTLRIAALLNLLVAVAAWKFPQRMPSTPVASINDTGDANRIRDGLGQTMMSAWFIYVAAFTTGFVFFLMELVWYRMLSPILGGTTYSYGLILAVALSGIGVGGGLYALVGGAAGRGVMVFGVSCGVEALLLAVPYLLGDWIGVFAAIIHPLQGLGLPGQVLSYGLVAVVVVFPASVAAGYQFPLIIALLGRGDADIGRHTGNAYAFNTAGAITGALASGFGLMTVLSAPGCWRLAVVILLLLSVAAAYVASCKQSVWPVVLASAAAAAVAVLVFLASGPTAAWRHSPIGAGRLALANISPNEMQDKMAHTRRNLLWEMDGKESAIGLILANGYAFVINGKVDGHAVGDAATQVTCGLIGAAIHPEPKRSLVIGLGTGSTAGWLARVPSMTRVDVVEIEPGIAEVARVCTPVNQDVLNNPKVNIIFDDAREILTTSEQTYDLIFSEPSNPYRAGIASLYTVEFYREAVKRMAPGGIFTQWVQAYEIAPRTIKSIYVTLSGVFPYIDTWRTKTNDLVLLCSMTPMRMNRGALATRLASEPFYSALLNTWHTTGVEGFLSRYVANGEFAGLLSRTQHPDWWMNTDDRMQIEFDFARTLGANRFFQIQDLLTLAMETQHHRPSIDPSTVAWDKVQEEASLAQLLEIGGASLPEAPVPGQNARIEAYGRFVRKQFKALQDLVAGGRFQPVEPTDYLVSAMAKATAGDASALEDIRILKRTRPTDAEAITAVYFWHASDMAAAMAHLERTILRLREDPWHSAYCVLPALDIAQQLARQDGADIKRLMNLLTPQFSVGMYSEYRMRLLLRVASLGGYEKGAEVLALFEPDVPWEAGFLTYRRDVYRMTKNHRLAQAERDYDLFNKNASKSLSDFVE
ncbi:MAG: fused MFS/spermidine synthase [Pseudomonadota bacterium]